MAIPWLRFPPVDHVSKKEINAESNDDDDNGGDSDDDGGMMMRRRM